MISNCYLFSRVFSLLPILFAPSLVMELYQPGLLYTRCQCTSPFTTCCWLRNQITRLSGNSAVSAWDATPGPVLGPLACFPSTSFFHPSSTKGFAGFLLFPWHLHQTLFSPAAVPFPSLARNTLGYFFPVSHGQYKTSSLLLWEFLLLFAVRKHRVAYKHKKSQQI